MKICRIAKDDPIRRQAMVQNCCFASRDGVTSAAVTVEGGLATATEEKTVEEEQFDWDKAWYPVALTKTLNKRVPEPVTILGRPLVIWFDQVSDQWRVFHDLCPHRLAPLSGGRIHESGELQCSYHGWTFSGEGSCGFIPLAPTDGPAVNVSPRACARVYPCREHQGIIWFWPDYFPSAAAEAAAAPPPPTLPEFDDPTFRYDTGMSDLEYGTGCLKIRASNMTRACLTLIMACASNVPVFSSPLPIALPSFFITSPTLPHLLPSPPPTAMKADGESVGPSACALRVFPSDMAHSPSNVSSPVTLLVPFPTSHSYEMLMENLLDPAHVPFVCFHLIWPIPLPTSLSLSLSRSPSPSHSYEMLMENLLDPAHVPFAHHKYQGDRNKASPLPSMVVTSITARGIEGNSFVFGPATVVPPCTLIQKLYIGGKVPEGSGQKQRTVILFFHCIPRMPGQSRLIWFFLKNIIPAWMPMPPEWFVHLLRMKVSDTDHVLLHLTERRLEEEGGAVQGIKSYYTPTSSDSFISAFRSWLRRFAGGKARFPAYVDPKLPPAKSRREILDRQRFHVQLCPDCQRVQRWSDRLRTTLWAATLLLAATALFPLAPPAIKNAVGPAGAVFAVAAAVACAAAAHWLKGFIERNYVYEDFVHALWYPAKKSV
ncbi:unnamed protein product [Closterium sp. NIES-53]